jgi:putative hydrolase of the HAD superfamily
MPTIKIVTFDLDNTLWDVDLVVRGAEQQMRAWLQERVPEYSTRFTADEIAVLRGRVVTEQPALRHNLSKLRETVLYEAIVACGYGAAEARRHAATAFGVFFEARHQVEFFPGALDTLADLAGRFRLAALTNGNADFTKLALDRFFSFGFSAADVGVGKPAPDMFHAALRQAGATPAQSIHVGDHLIDDIQGASDVGMHTIWVNLTDTAPPADAASPSHTVRTLTQIPAGVDAIAARS